MLFTKYNINTTLFPQSKKGKHFVRIRVSAQSSRVDLYTGISLTNSQWDKKKQQVKQGYVINNVTYNILNGTLEEYKNFIRDYFNSCAMRDTRPSLSELQERFNKRFKMSSEAQSDEFFYLFDKFIEEKSKERG
ncbi:MAG: Arm DNA-binding domain-containing protein [Bacteroidales bacterium]|nr:Arm DNA-binding domain-containing protein [Bacteroidales bacterium]